MDPKEKSLVQNLQTHDLAERYRLRRATLAREAGLPVEAFALPFPGNQVTTTTNNTGGGLVRGAVLSALLLVAGGGGTLGGLRLLERATTTHAPELANPAAPTSGSLAPQNFDIRVEQQQPDGSWKRLSSQRVRLQADKH
jgi:hypothetical protein